MAGADPDRMIYTKNNAKNTSKHSRHSNEKTTSEKSWRAPATILLALLMGLGVALAHHSMNVRLNNKPVAEIKVSQAWISRFSTALAFLTNTCFIVSVGASFTQRQWLRFHQQSFTIAQIDAVTGILGNLLGFFSSRVWFRHPILVLTALASWVIPLSAVVTPGSLSVIPLRTTAAMSLQVPQPSFNRTYYGYAYGSTRSHPRVATMTGERLLRIAYATASSTQLVPLSPIYQNYSYHLQFNGPAVRCGAANESLIHDISQESSNLTSKDFAIYASWVPGPSEGNRLDRTGSATLLNGTILIGRTLDYVSRDGARIFIMSNVPPASFWEVFTEDIDSPRYRVNVTECLLFNATYDVDFNFQYPQHTHRVNISTWLNPVSSPLNDDSFLIGDGSENTTADAIISYCALMNAFGSLLVGKMGLETVNASYYATNWQMIKIDWARAEAVEAGLEQLFQNFTVSLLSDSGLTKNSADAAFVPVTVETWPITYIYNRPDLLLPYGLAFLATTISAMVGLHAFFVNKDSYQNIFSTFLRVTNDSYLRALIDPGDAGADPLPRHLAQVRIRMVREEEAEDRDAGKEPHTRPSTVACPMPHCRLGISLEVYPSVTRRGDVRMGQKTAAQVWSGS
ncbi:uncharacterized protein BDR25DRAFT_320387 [Lindgomyces ingoldianus]|uniref:Uncharacterized protein n=1 Tax=Lindgomyces ingoldianus TaxID=673940 RepID=A0ACB6Q7S8_9PLEO|nr:uncharacterized protein BDR25DRAFT_320387 [Lindgomyces ingoldianus]KAF2462933.1 hypothetical protein BDR25DRAFT_320387 [Lindgomyces ingoldianus]